MNNELLTSIDNPTLAHFRHFSSLFTNFSSTTVERPLQISSFLTNKANFPKSQMNVTKEMKKNYVKRTLGQRGKNKANSKPNKANLQKAQINVTKVITKDYENKINWAIYENEPNSNPIQTQTKPISNAKNNPAGSKKKGLFGVASIIRENKMLTESVFGEIIKFPLLMKILRFLHVSERVKIMKRYLTITAWLVIFVAAFGLACRQEPPTEGEAEQPEPNVPAQIETEVVEPKRVPADKVAVTVNGVDITENELEAEIKQMATRLPPAYLEQNKEKIRQQTLDRMITMRLLEEKIKAAKIVVTEEEVLDQIKETASRQGLSLDDFKAMLQTRGTNFDEWKQQMQFGRRAQFQKLFDAEFAVQLNITENEANNYYSENTKRFETLEQVRASHILIKPDTTDPDADPNEAKAKALAKTQDLLKQIKEGADFAELAGANSDCPSKAKGGDLGLFGRGRMVPPFEKTAFTLKVNEVSDIVETRFGYHIIKVTDRKEASVKTFEQAKDEIIKMLKQKKQGELITKYIESLKAQANIVYPPGKEPLPPRTPSRMPSRPPSRQ